MSCFSDRCRDNMDTFLQVTELTHKVFEYTIKKIVKTFF